MDSKEFRKKMEALYKGVDPSKSQDDKEYFRRDAISYSQKEYLNDPENLSAHKERAQNPERNKKVSEGNKKRFQDPEYLKEFKENRSDMSDPNSDWNKNLVKSNKEQVKTKKWKENHRKAIDRINSALEYAEYREKRKEINANMANNENHKKGIAKKMERYWKDTKAQEHAKKVAKKRAEKQKDNPEWKAKIKDAVKDRGEDWYINMAKSSGGKPVKTDWGIFASASRASEAAPYPISKKVIRSRASKNQDGISFISWEEYDKENNE